MSRYDLLLKAINTNIIVSEKSGNRINDWSPNNVRRLVISCQGAAIQFHVTGKRYPKLIKLISFKDVIDEELTLALRDMSKYKPILRVLTDGRVLSSVEEIVFCSKGYALQLLPMDLDFEQFTKNKGFPRLSSIAVVDSDFMTVVNLMNSVSAPTKLLSNLLKEKNIRIQERYVDKDTSGWWRGTALRPQYYVMDEADGALAKRFALVREKFEAIEREKKLSDVESAEKEKFVSKSLLPAIRRIAVTKKMMFEMSECFKNASIIDKTEWAKYLAENNVQKGILKWLSKTWTQEKYNEVRSIDIEEILKLDVSLVSNDDMDKVAWFSKICVEGILKDSMYKQETKLSDFETSVKLLDKYASMIMKLVYFMVLTSLSCYLLRNTTEYVEEQWGRLVRKSSLRDFMFKYSKSSIEFCNYLLGTVNTSHAFSKVGAELISSNDETASLVYMESTTILVMLSKLCN